jgi:hypothetical protein
VAGLFLMQRSVPTSSEPASVSGMSNLIGGKSENQDESYPGALTEGTHHRGGKGEGRSTGQVVTSRLCATALPPARVGLKEAIGASRVRTKVKRRKAAVEGELARSSDAQFLLVLRMYWRRARFEISCSYPERCVGFPLAGRP